MFDSVCTSLCYIFPFCVSCFFFLKTSTAHTTTLKLSPQWGNRIIFKPKDPSPINNF